MTNFESLEKILLISMQLRKVYISKIGLKKLLIPQVLMMMMMLGVI